MAFINQISSKLQELKANPPSIVPQAVMDAGSRAKQNIMPVKNLN
jgi:hypothetical protein